MLRMFAALSRAQPMQSTLQMTVFSNNIPLCGRRVGIGAGFSFVSRRKSPQRVQVGMGIFPLTSCS